MREIFINLKWREIIKNTVKGTPQEISRLNKPERVFGLQVRCRKLDIFKIRNFLKLFWIF